ncbi:MAG: hypothetical protein HYZ29_05785 [Myxococcales bacterium]|nr:hypothetical protein [Myxococcales bacterium]
MNRHFRIAALLSFIALPILIGCGDDDGGGGSGGGSGSGGSGGSAAGGAAGAGGTATGGAAGAAGAAGAGGAATGGTGGAGTGGTATGGTGGSSAGGKGLKGTGTYKGSSFSFDCDFSNFNQGSLMCQSLQWFAFCRPAGKVADIDQFQLWFHLPSAQGTAGPHDFKGVAGGGLKMGDSMGTPMDQDDANATENVITVTKAGAAQQPIAGTFSAKWSNAGAGHGEVSGSFDFDCK